MIQIILERIKQGFHTMAYPAGPPPQLSARFQGWPSLNPKLCDDNCSKCATACPTDAIDVSKQDLRLDLGRCLFCRECESLCPEGAIRFSNDYQLACRDRTDLVADGNAERRLTAALDEKIRKLFGRSLKLRQVSAGGCNGCEVEVNVINTIGWDLGRFGIQFVASPRHADGLLITGPVTQNMRLALEKTYAAVASPKIVIAVGACAISGGPYINHPEASNGAGDIVPVDLYIPGCPPHPLTTLDGLLRMLGRIEEKR